MKQLLHNPLAVLGIYYFFAAMVGGMPAPTSASGTGYVWLYNSLNIFAANVTKAASQMKNGASPLSIAASSQSANSPLSGEWKMPNRVVSGQNADPYSDLGK